MGDKESVNDNRVLDPETWVDRYGDYLYRQALSRIQDPTVAEDLVQETFVAALHARENFQGRSSEKTWLTAILRHKAIDYIRKKSKEKPVEDTEYLTGSMDELFDEKGDWKIKPAKWAYSPTELYEQKEFWKTLTQCLSQLTSRLSRAFTLREMDGLSTEEICKFLNVTATNLWVMLYRARMYMRRCLEINWFGSKNLGKS